MHCRAARKSNIAVWVFAACAVTGCAAPVKTPPLPPSTAATSAASSVKPASYTLPDGTKVHDVKCSCCQH